MKSLLHLHCLHQSVLCSMRVLQNVSSCRLYLNSNLRPLKLMVIFTSEKRKSMTCQHVPSPCPTLMSPASLSSIPCTMSSPSHTSGSNFPKHQTRWFQNIIISNAVIGKTYGGKWLKDMLKNCQVGREGE